MPSASNLGRGREGILLHLDGLTSSLTFDPRSPAGRRLEFETSKPEGRLGGGMVGERRRSHRRLSRRLTHPPVRCTGGRFHLRRPSRGTTAQRGPIDEPSARNTNSPQRSAAGRSGSGDRGRALDRQPPGRPGRRRFVPRSRSPSNRPRISLARTWPRAPATRRYPARAALPITERTPPTVARLYRRAAQRGLFLQSPIRPNAYSSLLRSRSAGVVVWPGSQGRCSRTSGPRRR